LSLLLLYFIAHAYRNPSKLAVALIALSIGVMLAAFITRIYSLRVQDRVIRLEERLRLTTLLPQHMHARINDLTEGQLIGLRFASDAELPALAERAINEKLSKDAIKKAIASWRADHWRV
jgi:hypothetical protein